MPRPKRTRTIVNPPAIDGLKPIGIRMNVCEKVILLYEEYEALRLSDYEGMTQEQAAREMGVSRPTFTRVYENARRCIAKALVEGKAIVIEGGCYQTKGCGKRCAQCQANNENDSKCPNCVALKENNSDSSEN